MKLHFIEKISSKLCVSVIQSISILLIFLTSAMAVTQPVLSIQHWELPNKTRVFFVQRTELPTLDVEWVADAGSARDGKQFGLATLTSAMLDQGVQGLTAQQIANQFENIGAEVQTFSNRDNAGMTLRTLVDEKKLSTAITLFRKILSSPTFAPTELPRVKSQIIAALKSQQEDPWQVAKNQFYAALYGEFPYAHNPLGNEKTVAAITRAQLQQFYRQYYVGANANLILVGDITEVQAKAIAATIAGEIPAGDTAKMWNPVAMLSQARTIRIHFPSKQSTLLLGQVGISRENPEYFPLMIGNTILGGMPMTSILYDNIREKNGLAYSVTSDFNPLRYRGPFLIGLQTKTASLAQSERLTQQLLKQFVNNGPSDFQLQSAKQFLIGYFPTTFSSNKNILAVVANMAFYHRPLDFLDTYEKNVSDVTSDQVKNAFQKSIHPSEMVTVVVG